MSKLISEKYENWKHECNTRFQKLKANEEVLNRIFIDIYGLQDELTPEVADKDVTVHCVFDSKDDVPESMKGSNYVRTKHDEIVSLISYAVGCIFGRYSVDCGGLCYAGGDWDDSKYQTIIPDKDNVVPICDDEYFQDDLTARIIDFVRKVYGEDTLEENLKFIADALGTKGTTPREVIRNYLLTGSMPTTAKLTRNARFTGCSAQAKSMVSRLWCICTAGRKRLLPLSARTMFTSYRNDTERSFPCLPTSYRQPPQATMSN